MNVVEFNTENDWSESPNGDGLYKIKLHDGKIEIAVIWGEGERARIKSLKGLDDSEPIHHPFYKGAWTINLYKMIFKTPVREFIPIDDGCRAIEGDIVVCIVDNLKNFTKGLYYRVDRIREVPHHCGSNSLKLEGIAGFIKSNNFSLLSKDEARDVILANLLYDGSAITNEPTKERKIDLIDNKNCQLFELILNRMARDHNNLDSIDYSNFDTMIDVISKGDKSWGIESKDFNELKQLTISQAFDLLISNKQKN